jgi:hypothetical protein
MDPQKAVRIWLVVGFAMTVAAIAIFISFPRGYGASRRFAFASTKDRGR